MKPNPILWAHDLLTDRLHHIKTTLSQEPPAVNDQDNWRLDWCILGFTTQYLYVCHKIGTIQTDLPFLIDPPGQKPQGYTHFLSSWLYYHKSQLHISENRLPVFRFAAAYLMLDILCDPANPLPWEALINYQHTMGGPLRHLCSLRHNNTHGKNLLQALINELTYHIGLSNLGPFTEIQK